MILTTILLSSAITYTTIRDEVYFQASKHGIEPELVLAIIKTESNFNPKAVGKTHKERGLMQLRPKYHKASFDIKENIEEGVTYLAKLKKICKKRYQEAWWICYNTGSNKTIKNPHKFGYYKKVMREYDSYIIQNYKYCKQ